jgi:hypothetical protein
MKSKIQIRAIPLRTEELLEGVLISVLTSRNGRSKNVGIFSIVISELKFGNIQRHIFAADLVKRTDNTALKDRPEAFDCLCVNRTELPQAARLATAENII